LNQFGLSLSLVWEILNGLVWGLAKSGLNQTKPNFPNTSVRYPCAMVEWFTPDDERDNETGMWVVRPEFEGVRGRHMAAIIHLDCIARAAVTKSPKRPV
jgi:hypothetical protein